MSPELQIAIAAAGVCLFFLVAMVVLIRTSLVRVASNEALVVLGTKEPTVRFVDSLVIPILQRADRISLRPVGIEIVRRGKDGLSCRDGIRADLVARFLVAIERRAESVLAVAARVGSERATDPATLHSLLEARFVQALKDVASHLEFEELSRLGEEFRSEVLNAIGEELDGYVVEALTIVSLEQTPIEQLDPHNILDAEGIARLKEVAAQAQLRSDRSQHEAARRRAELESQLRELELELAAREADAFGRYRDRTGRDIGKDELAARIEEKLRELSAAQGGRV